MFLKMPSGCLIGTAAIVTVVAAHVVLVLYVAWNEGSGQWCEGKQD